MLVFLLNSRGFWVDPGCNLTAGLLMSLVSGFEGDDSKRLSAVFVWLLSDASESIN